MATYQTMSVPVAGELVSVANFGSKVVNNLRATDAHNDGMQMDNAKY